jgi:hypothetical protein
MAFKIGQLKFMIRSPRNRWAQFDIELSTTNCSRTRLPLDLLEAKMDTWVASQLR